MRPTFANRGFGPFNRRIGRCCVWKVEAAFLSKSLRRHPSPVPTSFSAARPPPSIQGWGSYLGSQRYRAFTRCFTLRTDGGPVLSGRPVLTVENDFFNTPSYAIRSEHQRSLRPAPCCFFWVGSSGKRRKFTRLDL